jgi:hypothetical protein
MFYKSEYLQFQEKGEIKHIRPPQRKEILIFLFKSTNNPWSKTLGRLK